MTPEFKKKLDAVSDALSRVQTGRIERTVLNKKALEVIRRRSR